MHPKQWFEILDYESSICYEILAYESKLLQTLTSNFKLWLFCIFRGLHEFNCSVRFSGNLYYVNIAT